MAEFTRGCLTVEVIQKGTMSKAEVRLFFYFLTKEAKGNLPSEKIEEFRNLLENGKLPWEMGYMTRNGRNVFCIRRGNAGYYDLYMAEHDDTGFNKFLQKIFSKVKM